MPRLRFRLALLVTLLLIVVFMGHARAQMPPILTVPSPTVPNAPDVISFGPVQLLGPTSVSIRVTADTYITLPSAYIKAIVEAQSPSFLQQEMLIVQRMQPIAPTTKPNVAPTTKPVTTPTVKPTK